jgi:hypothetical protein
MIFGVGLCLSCVTDFSQSAVFPLPNLILGHPESAHYHLRIMSEP